MSIDEPQEGDEEYVNPAQRWRPFGAGLKRKRIDFVPASDDAKNPSAGAGTVSSPGPKPSLSERYLSITLGEGAASEKEEDEEGRKAPSAPGASATNTHTRTPPPEGNPSVPVPDILFCKTCQTPITVADTDLDPAADADGKKMTTTTVRDHESSIAHQASLQHSHPPSHLDRNRRGLKYLASYGWDPDERRGLGASGDGIRVPLKARVKNDTLGLGLKRLDPGQQPVPVQRLDAKGMRKQEREERKKREKLHQMFYASVDVEKYLGG